MGVTVVQCSVKNCPVLLNAEICRFEKRKPVCNAHSHKYLPLHPIHRGETKEE